MFKVIREPLTTISVKLQGMRTHKSKNREEWLRVVLSASTCRALLWHQHKQDRSKCLLARDLHPWGGKTNNQINKEPEDREEGQAESSMAF